MRHRSLLSAACAAVALISAVPGLALAQVPPAPQPAVPATSDAFTYQDMISANRLGDPQVSPDGRYVVYSVTTTDVDANRRAGSLWMLDLNTPDAAPRRLAISDQGANTARWGGGRQSVFPVGQVGDQTGLARGLAHGGAGSGDQSAAGRERLSRQPDGRQGGGLAGRLSERRRPERLGRDGQGHGRAEDDRPGL